MHRLLFALFLATSAVAQAPEVLTVALDARPERGPFFYLAGSAESLPDGTPVTGIPDSLDGLRLFGEPIWVPEADDFGRAVFATARTPDGDHALIFDTDGDYDLADETAHVYPALPDASQRRAYEDAVQPVRVRVRSGSGSQTLDLRPFLYLVNPDGEPWVGEDGERLVFLEIGGHRTGAVDIGGEHLRIAAGHQGRAGRYSMDTLEILIGDDPEPYTSSEVLPLGQDGYRVAWISPSGDALTLVRDPDGPPQDGLRVGQIAPAITGTALDGTAFDLYAFRGRYVLLEFWGSWCRPCVQNAPVMAEAYERFGGDRFAIVGIANDRAEAVEAFVERHGHPWPQLIQAEGGDQSVLAAYDVEVYPTTFLLDPDGRIVTKENLAGPALLGTLGRLLGN